MSLIFRSRPRVMQLAIANRRSQPVPPASPDAAAAELLVRLHDCGALSDADFAVAKRTVLRIPPDRAPPA